MEPKRTLWVLSYTEKNGWGTLVYFYGLDESEAWERAVEWANKHDIRMPKDAQMMHCPRGFLMYRLLIPGLLGPCENEGVEQLK